MTSTGTPLIHWWHPAVPIGFQLETVADLKQCHLIEVTPDELQADRQSSLSEPTRNTQRRGSGEVCRISVPPDRTQDGNGLAGDLHVRLVNARCRDRYCRRRKNINLLERCAELLGNNPSDPLCQKVICRKKHHSRIELLANVAGHVIGVDAHHLTVIRRCLGAKDCQLGTKRVTQVWNRYLLNFPAETIENS